MKARSRIKNALDALQGKYPPSLTVACMAGMLFGIMRVALTSDKDSQAKLNELALEFLKSMKEVEDESRE